MQLDILVLIYLWLSSSNRLPAVNGDTLILKTLKLLCGNTSFTDMVLVLEISLLQQMKL